METKERLYGKITVTLPHECKHMLTYYILDSTTEIDGKMEHVYGLKAEEIKVNIGASQVKSIIDISSSCEEIERLAKKMLLELVALLFFEDVIEDYVSYCSAE